MTRRIVGISLLLVGFIALILWVWRTPSPIQDPSPEQIPLQGSTASEARPRWANEPLRLSPAQVDANEELRSPDTGSLGGRVMDWASGAGIAGAELTFLRDGGVFSTLTQDGGTFRLRVDQSGTYQLATVTAAGYVPFAPTWQQSPIRFSARTGQHLDGAQIHLVPTGTWSILVIDQDKQPVPNARITLTEDASPAAAQVSPVSTSSDGRASIEGAPRKTVTVEHPDFKRAFAGLGREPRELTVRLHRLGEDDSEKASSIAGVVLNPKDVPIPGATVQTWLRRRGAPPATLSVSTDRDGRFVFTDLRPGKYRLAARYQDFVVGQAAGISAGTDDVILRLGRSGVLSGRVTDARTAKPVVAFTITYQATQGRRVVSYFDAEGRFEARGLPVGPVSLRAMAHGYAASARVASEILADESQEQTVDIELFTEGRVWGKVVDADTAAPISGASVYAEGHLARGDHAVPVAARTTTDSEGAFELGGLALGLRSLTFEDEHFHTRIVSGLSVEERGDIGPLTVEMTPVKQGEEPHLELTGIGATLDLRGPDELLVRRTFAGGGAAEIGLSEGDAIVSVDGIPISDMSTEDAIERIRGEEGTVVQLGIRSHGSDEVIEIPVVRRRIKTG